MSLISCARIESVGFKKHEFGELPKKIIWLQVPGLLEEHLAFIKFNFPDEQIKTPLENTMCRGTLWNYNFYKIRTSPKEGLRAQILGSKNIKNSCDDFSRPPVWSLLSENKFNTVILEGPTKKNQSIEMVRSCSANLENNIVWLMKKKRKEDPIFHFQNKTPLQKGIAYDKSCQQKGCFASINNNAIELWKRIKKSKDSSLMIIRNFNYYNNLIAQNYNGAVEVLNEILMLYSFFQEELKSEDKALLLLSTTAGKQIELPVQGNKWLNLNKKGAVLYKRNSLLSHVWADGAGAENFCGHYSESDLLKRIFVSPSRERLGIFKL